MAAAPPPYNSRDNRQQWKDWGRAQKQAARAQRAYWSYHRRGSIAGPIILLTIGVIALLIETDRLSSGAFWGWYAHWWPMLLIGIGLILLVEYFFDRNNPYAGRRSFGGFGFLILLILIGGWGTHAAHFLGPFSDQFSDNGDDFWSMVGEEHDNDIDLNQDIAPNAGLQVQNPRGDVTITASPDAQIHVKAHQVVHASDDEARKIFAAVAPKLINSGSNAVLSVESRNNARVDLTLEVPATVTASVNAGRGDVTIEGLRTASDVTANRGDVKFDSMGGNIHARMDKGDFSAHSITGNVSVDGHADDVTLSDVKGAVAMNGEFFGDTHLEQVSSAVHFHSSRTELDVSKLSGDMTLNKDSLNMSQPVGPIRIIASKDIDLSQVTGDVHIENNNGDVSIVSALPLGNFQVANRNGDVSVTVPENTGFSVSASNADGDLHSDFPLTINNDGDRKSANGQVGSGGPRLVLSTGHGDLQLRKGNDAVPTPPPAPKAPSQPKAPKHLRVPSDGASEQPTEQ